MKLTYSVHDERVTETADQANDRLMSELAHEVAEWGELAHEQAQLIKSLGGRRNHQRIKGTR